MPTQQTNRLISRRNFNTAIATSAILKSGTCSAQDQIESKTNWIDAHAHVWHPDTERYPISRNYKIEDMQPKSFTEKELISHCKPAGVNRIVLIQMSFYEYDHRYMEEVMRANPNRFSGVSLIDWNQRRLQAEVRNTAVPGCVDSACTRAETLAGGRRIPMLGNSGVSLQTMTLQFAL